MPKRMSFMLTKQQVRDRTKDVTRRIGWEKLQPGEVFLAVEKCMGLKKGDKHVVLATCRCLKNEPEELRAMPAADCAREGFPHLSPREFVQMFCQNMACTPKTKVRRIEFEYIDENEVANG